MPIRLLNDHTEPILALAYILKNDICDGKSNNVLLEQAPQDFGHISDRPDSLHAESSTILSQS